MVCIGGENEIILLEQQLIITYVFFSFEKATLKILILKIKFSYFNFYKCNFFENTLKKYFQTFYYIK